MRVRILKRPPPERSSLLRLFPVVLTMLEAIRDFYIENKVMVGMKPAGGISTAKMALHYLVMVKEVLGEKMVGQ